MEELEIVVNGVYRTHVNDLVKVIKIDEENDCIHLFNISDRGNQWVSLSRAKAHKFISRVN